MPIPSTLADENGSISINRSVCTGCGLCVSICPDNGLCLVAGKAAPSSCSIFGCFACGHCMAVCPTEAITVSGRMLSPDDLFPLPPQKSDAYESFMDIAQRRRSVRSFAGEPVSREDIRAILEAIKSAPMGIPPSETRVLVLDNREKVYEFSKEICAAMEKIQWLTKPWALKLLRLFRKREDHEFLSRFVGPLMRTYSKFMAQGQDVILYNAPLAMYFYGSPYAESEPIIAATYAMLAGEALGLGTCLIGSVHPFLQYSPLGAKVREKYGIKYKSKQGIAVIFGHPAVCYQKGIRRTLAEVHSIA